MNRYLDKIFKKRSRLGGYARFFIICLVCCLLFVGCDMGENTSKQTVDFFGGGASTVGGGANGNQNNDSNNSNNGNNGNTSNNGKRVALTFDDGPHETRTIAIVDELERYGYNATFFVVGNRVDGTAYSGGAALKYAVEAGNEIGIHGYTHEVYYHNCSDATYEYELSQTVKAIQSYADGYNVRLMRPIGGNITNARVNSCDYSVIMWSVDSEDWKYRGNGEDKQQNINTIVENVMSQVKNGSIILMHDIYDNTYEAAKIILKRLHDEGYDVVTVSELLGSSMKAGKKYSSLASNS